MLDHILGRPSPSVRRTQIYVVLFFWVWRLYKGDGSAMRQGSGRRRVAYNPHVRTVSTHSRTWWRRVWVFLVAKRSGFSWMTRLNQRLKSFTPYQLILGSLTMAYALRHLDDLLGIGAPEPLAKMYSRSYYRATYINTALDAGFASAMAIRPKWLKDICSVLFGVYYLVWATEGDEVLRRYRALCNVEMLRTTWEKTNNPYLRFLGRHFRVKLPVVRYVYIPRPKTSSRAKLPPVKAMLFFDGSEEELTKATELVLDFPGGGFISMGPECHEERLRVWAKRTHKPIVSIDYGKAPEYPYPWAIEEGIDAYRTVTDSKGAILGIKSGKLGVVLTGDSAGGNICTTIMNRILEHHKHITRPIAIILAYPALDFNFTSWMSPTNLKVLQTEQSEVHIPGLLHGKDHMRHKSPLSVVDDVGRPKQRRAAHRSRKSWAGSIVDKLGISMTPSTPVYSKSTPQSPVTPYKKPKRVESGWFASKEDGGESSAAEDLISELSDSEEDDDYFGGSDSRRDADKSLQERVKTPGVHADEHFTEGILSSSPEKIDQDVAIKRKKTTIGTRLTMTSRVGYFQDRIITPSMMRAMAILYVGPQQSPDFQTDYYISPILSPPHLLAHFPPVYLICGERDPFVDDTVVFAGKLREAKRARRAQANDPDSNPEPKVNGQPQEDILRETDEDWVQMRIIEGWGHGFMQMTALMKEVHSVLIEMADWIDESFESNRQSLGQEEVAAFKPESPVFATHEESLKSPAKSRHVKPAREYTLNPSKKPLGDADLGGGFGEDDGDDGDSIVTFTPKNKKRTPPPSMRPIPTLSTRAPIPRNNSAPRFDEDFSGSSGETLETPPDQPFSLPSAPYQPKGTATFGLFSRPQAPRATVQKSPATSLYASGPVRRTSATSTPVTHAPTPLHNPLVKAAVATAARAASPALAAAGLVPQSVNSVSEAELFRRRRAEAVMGMGGDPGDDVPRD